MKTPHGSPVTLHLEFGIQFLTSVLNRYGADGWNRWLNAMVDCLPLSWGDGEYEPPAHLWFDAQGADFSGLKLDGADLGLFNCEKAKFDGASAIGTMFSDVPHASFQGVNLRDALFTGNITATEYRGCTIEGMSIEDAHFAADNPPLGLPADLLKTCRAESPVDDKPDDWQPVEVGLVKHPVPVKTSLSASAEQ